jgi:hypothetical protein
MIAYLFGGHLSIYVTGESPWGSENTPAKSWNFLEPNQN